MLGWQRGIVWNRITVGFVIAATLFSACQTANGVPTVAASPPAGAARVQLYVEPDDGAKPIVAFVNGARQTLDVAMYLLTDREVITAIEGAERRGVSVRVMLEEHPYGEGAGNGAVYQRLEAAKVAVKWSPSTFQLSHDKYAVADRRTSLIGTANWTVSAFKNNREYIVVDGDPADVNGVADLFDADWNRTSTTADDQRLVVSPTNSRADLLRLVGGARQRLDIEAEELQDPEIEGALAAAAKRGVTVRVVLPQPTVGSDPNQAGRARIEASGATVRLLTSPYVHAKDIIVDTAEAFVGSENLSKPSLDNNREVGLLLSDPTAI